MKSLIAALITTVVTASSSLAQSWRVQVSGGIVKPDVLVGVSDGVTHPIKYANGYYATLPLYRRAISSIAGLSVLRSDSSMEYGVSVQALPLHFSQFFSSTHEYNPDSIWLQQAYLAKPAIPITAVFNYMHHRS